MDINLLKYKTDDRYDIDVSLLLDSCKNNFEENYFYYIFCSLSYLEHAIVVNPMGNHRELIEKINNCIKTATILIDKCIDVENNMRSNLTSFIFHPVNYLFYGHILEMAKADRLKYDKDDHISSKELRSVDMISRNNIIPGIYKKIINLDEMNVSKLFNDVWVLNVDLSDDNKDFYTMYALQKPFLIILKFLYEVSKNRDLLVELKVKNIRQLYTIFDNLINRYKINRVAFLKNIDAIPIFASIESYTKIYRELLDNESNIEFDSVDAISDRLVNLLDKKIGVLSGNCEMQVSYFNTPLLKDYTYLLT